MNKPKVLFLDIETLPNVVFCFQLFNKYINPEMLIKEKAIISFAWKWLGDNETHVMVSKEPYEDKELIIGIAEILKEADYVVAHYGDKFDMRFIRSRALFHGVTSVPIVPTIDTYKLAKKYFHLNANRLDYLGAYLKVGRKLNTSFKLWADCAAGKQKAINEMAQYNKQDVILLERVFMAMLPHVESKLNHGLFTDSVGSVCPSCGSKHVVKRGFLVNKVSRRQRYQCNKCGSWFSERMKKDVGQDA